MNINENFALCEGMVYEQSYEKAQKKKKSNVKALLIMPVTPIIGNKTPKDVESREKVARKTQDKGANRSPEKDGMELRHKKGI